MEHSLTPLTERILARLGSPRAVWIAFWALIPWLNAGANLVLGTRTSAVWEQNGVLVVLNYAAISFAAVISLLGTGRIARRLEVLQATTKKILVGESCEPFRGMNSYGQKRKSPSLTRPQLEQVGINGEARSSAANPKAKAKADLRSRPGRVLPPARVCGNVS